MVRNTLNINDKVTLDDLLALKDKLVTHFCFVHDEEDKKKIQDLGIMEIHIIVSAFIEKNTLVLVDKNTFEMG